MQHEAARPKGNRAPGDQPTSQPMHATRQGEVRRNPSTDQKKARRENQRKVAVYGDEDGWQRATYQEQYGRDPDEGWCGHCDSDQHSTLNHRHDPDYEGMGPDAARWSPDHNASRKVAVVNPAPMNPNRERCPSTDRWDGSCMFSEGHDWTCEYLGGDEDSRAEHAFEEPGPDAARWKPEHNASQRKAVMSQRKIATQFDTQAWKLNPGDNVRMPNGRTMKVNRVRPHETSGHHVYVDTDGGTAQVGRNDAFHVVHKNQQQQSLPGYGTPGGNTNRLPFDPQTNNEGGPKSDNQGGKDCPSCGSKGSMQRQGDKYVCSRCGFSQTFGGAGGHSFTDQPHQLQNTSSYSTINTSGMSAIARRAHAVLDQKETK